MAMEGPPSPTSSTKNSPARKAGIVALAAAQIATMAGAEPAHAAEKIKQPEPKVEASMPPPMNLAEVGGTIGTGTKFVVPPSPPRAPVTPGAAAGKPAEEVGKKPVSNTEIWKKILSGGFFGRF